LISIYADTGAESESGDEKGREPYLPSHSVLDNEEEEEGDLIIVDNEEEEEDVEGGGNETVADPRGKDAGNSRGLQASEGETGGEMEWQPSVPPADANSGQQLPGQPSEGPGMLNTSRSQPGAAAAGQQTLEVLSGQRVSTEKKVENDARRLRAKREEELNVAMGDNLLPYQTVLKHSAGQLTAPDLQEGSDVAAPDLGSMVSECDGRMRLADINIVLGQKKNWTASFDITTGSMECLGCKNHHGPVDFPRRGSNVMGGRQTIWLTDQSMPAILPASGTLHCVKILRLENGRLTDMAEGLVDFLRGRQVAAGSGRQRGSDVITGQHGGGRHGRLCPRPGHRHQNSQ
jgi:hypothetical protein